MAVTTSLFTPPTGTPVWLIRGIAVLVAVVPFILAIWKPDNTFTTPAAQAAIVVIGLLVASFIFVAHLVITSVEKYGWNKNAAMQIESAGEAELKELLPEARSLVATAQPILADLNNHSAIIQKLVDDVGEVKGKLNTISTTVAPVDKAVLKSALSELLGVGNINIVTAHPPTGP